VHAEVACFGSRSKDTGDEARVAAVRDDRQQRRVPSHDDQHRGIDGRSGSEGTGREPPSAAELPPWPPLRADEIRRRTISDAHTLTRYLPLHDEVGALEPARGRVEQPPEDGGRHPEREVRDDAVPIGGQRHVAGIGTQHDDVADTGEPSREAPHELRVDLDGEYVRRTGCERLGEDAATGAELDHPVVVVDAGVRDELRRQPGATEEVLTEVPATAPPAGCVPAHG
jgi:hypothetical protein